VHDLRLELEFGTRRSLETNFGGVWGVAGAVTRRARAAAFNKQH